MTGKRSSVAGDAGPAEQRRPGGFTLIELLVAAAMGAVLLIGAVTLLLAHLRSSTRMAVLLHLQDQCARVQFLIDHEIEQAEQATPVDDGLSLRVPGMATAITYRLNQGSHQLWRSGPSIDANGRLNPDPGKNGEHLVARDVEAFEVFLANPRAPRYRLTVRDQSGVSYTINANPSSSGGAFCRPREIKRSVSGS